MDVKEFGQALKITPPGPAPKPVIPPLNTLPKPVIPPNVTIPKILPTGFIPNIAPRKKQFCFIWADVEWGKDYPGWPAFRAWLVAHGTDVNHWIDTHQPAAKCIGATKKVKPPGKGAPPGADTYCFEWGGEKWGKDHPGWTAFKAWLIAHGANPDTWIDNHKPAANCIGATKATHKPPKPPPTPPDDPDALVVIPPKYCQNGTRRLIKRRWLAITIEICGKWNALVSSAYRTEQQNEDAGGATNSDHLRGDAVDFVTSALQAMHTWAVANKFPYVEPLSESVNHVHISFAHLGHRPPAPPTGAYTPLTGAAFVTQMYASADLYDVDPLGAFANAMDEGIHGAIGDSGNAFGPWQAWFCDGRLPQFGKADVGSDTVNAYAWSAEGIQEAFKEMADDHANHVHGKASVKLIMDNFERPTEKVQNLIDRNAYYDVLVGKGSGVKAYMASLADGPKGPLAPPDLPGIVSPDDAPRPKNAWGDLRTFFARDFPQAGQHASTVGNRLIKVVSTRPWTLIP